MLQVKHPKKYLKGIPDNAVVVIHINQDIRLERGHFHVQGTSAGILIDDDIAVRGPFFSLFPQLDK